MDDTAFVTSFVTQETKRINETLKEMYANGQTPSEEEKNAILADIENTLARLQSAVLHLGNKIAVENIEEMNDDE